MEVALIGIRKSFGKVVANDDISLHIPAGVIQGILGENGAGKSTLMKILSGFFGADQGEIHLDGQPVKIQSPADAIRHGIGMLHQDPLDFPPMKVVDNFLLGSPSGIFPNRRKITQELNELKEKFDFSIDIHTHIDTLTVGERQQIEILRLLWLGARVLILDEPTTGISATQKIKLFETLKQIASQGKTVIFVSHKLEDVEALCHQVAVLRQGQLVGESCPPYDTEQLVTLMFGKMVSMERQEGCEQDETLLELRGLAVEDYRMMVENVNINLKCGEVIGLAGMEGSGQLLFLRACAGLVRTVAGNIVLRDQDLTGKNFHTYMQHGVAYVPASRMEEGLIPGLSLTEHFILAGEQNKTFIDWQNALQITNQNIAQFNIRGAPNTFVESLSGGNQQRALLALLKTPLSLILMEHPTRGLDIESTIWIWRQLKDRCKQGSAIMFISADLDEILNYSDRILVFFAGKVSKPLNVSEVTQEKLGQLIGGKGW
jgi:simple sugar transport system ATP-binding protein